MTRADIEGQKLSQETNPCGRLVRGHYDQQRHVLSFDIPSFSRGGGPTGIVWGCELECLTGQFACVCEQFRPYPWEPGGPYRNMRNGAYRDAEHGVFLEHVYDIHPLITRKPSGLCPHGKKVREYLKRHRADDGRRLYDWIAANVKIWEDLAMSEQARRTA